MSSNVLNLCSQKKYLVTYRCNFTFLDLDGRVRQIMNNKSYVADGNYLRTFLANKMASESIFETQIQGNLITFVEDSKNTFDYGWCSFEINEICIRE